MKIWVLTKVQCNGDAKGKLTIDGFHGDEAENLGALSRIQRQIQVFPLSLGLFKYGSL